MALAWHHPVSPFADSLGAVCGAVAEGVLDFTVALSLAGSYIWSGGRGGRDEGKSLSCGRAWRPVKSVLTCLAALSQVIQQPPKPGALIRPPQVTLTQTPMVALRQPHNRIMLTAPQQIQLNQLQPGEGPGTLLLSTEGLSQSQLLGVMFCFVIVAIYMYH